MGFCSPPVGRGTIHNGDIERGDQETVQGVGIAGALYVFHRDALLLQRLAYLTYQGGFAAAGAALENENVLRRRGVDQLVVK